MPGGYLMAAPFWLSFSKLAVASSQHFWSLASIGATLVQAYIGLWLPQHEPNPFIHAINLHPQFLAAENVRLCRSKDFAFLVVCLPLILPFCF